MPERLPTYTQEIIDNNYELLDAPMDSPALTRLLDEVRGENAEVLRSYNRTYNRHNR